MQQVGSPPRMRERRVVDAVRAFNAGITPAYAGKTNQAINVDSVCKDHPRVCGKDVMSISVRALPLGSPPRMRERHVDCLIIDTV